MAYMSQEGYDKLVAELKQLVSVERPKASAAIAEARDKGDLSENSEYDAAKEAQAHLEDKINRLKLTIAEAKIIDTKQLSTDSVQIMSKVEMTNMANKAKMTYTIVSEREHLLQIVALSDTDGDTQHDTITERHHGRFHIVIGIMSLRDGIGTFQERALEILMYESQINGDMLDAQSLAVHLGERNLPLVMIASIVETDTQGYLVLLVIEQGNTIHTAAHNNY